MSVWNDESNCNKYVLDYWDYSPIEWQQKNREILNEAIKVFNEYVFNRATLNEVKMLCGVQKVD